MKKKLIFWLTCLCSLAWAQGQTAPTVDGIGDDLFSAESATRASAAQKVVNAGQLAGLRDDGSFIDEISDLLPLHAQSMHISGNEILEPVFQYGTSGHDVADAPLYLRFQDSKTSSDGTTRGAWLISFVARNNSNQPPVSELWYYALTSKWDGGYHVELKRLSGDENRLVSVKRYDQEPDPENLGGMRESKTDLRLEWRIGTTSSYEDAIGVKVYALNKGRGSSSLVPWKVIGSSEASTDAGVDVEVDYEYISTLEFGNTVIRGIAQGPSNNDELTTKGYVDENTPALDANGKVDVSAMPTSGEWDAGTLEITADGSRLTSVDAKTVEGIDAQQIRTAAANYYYKPVVSNGIASFEPVISADNMVQWLEGSGSGSWLDRLGGSGARLVDSPCLTLNPTPNGGNPNQSVEQQKISLANELTLSAGSSWEFECLVDLDGSIVQNHALVRANSSINDFSIWTKLNGAKGIWMMFPGDPGDGNPAGSNSRGFLSNALYAPGFHRLRMVFDGATTVSAFVDGAPIGTIEVPTHSVRVGTVFAQGGGLSTPGKVAYARFSGLFEYVFVEGAGATVHDVSGNGNHGTIDFGFGTETEAWANTQDEFHYAITKGMNKVLDLDSTDSVDMSSHDITLGDDDFTVAFWMKADPTAGEVLDVLGNYTTRSSAPFDEGVWFYLNDGKLNARLGNSTQHWLEVSTQNRVDDGRWRYIMLSVRRDALFALRSYDAETMVLDYASNYDVDLLGDNFGTFLGVNQDSPYPAFSGAIRGVSIYNDYYNAREKVNARYNPLGISGLIHHWKLAGDGLDSVGNAHATIQSDWVQLPALAAGNGSDVGGFPLGYPAGPWHNGASTKIVQSAANTQLEAADNGFWYNASVPQTVSYDQLKQLSSERVFVDANDQGFITSVRTYGTDLTGEALAEAQNYSPDATGNKVVMHAENGFEFEGGPIKGDGSGLVNLNLDNLDISADARIAISKIDGLGDKLADLHQEIDDVYAQEASVVVQVTDSETQNGNNLIAAYNAAKVLTPNGQPLSADNRAAVILPAGRYNLGSSKVLMNVEFVDLIGQIRARVTKKGVGTLNIGGANHKYVRTEWSGKNPAAHIIGSADVIRQEVGDVRLENLFVETTAVNDDDNFYGTAYSMPSSLNMDKTMIRHCRFLGASNDYDYDSCMSGSGGYGDGYDFSGYYEDCMGESDCWGSDNSEASGVFISCIGGEESFAGYGTASGIFIDCSCTEYGTAFGGDSGDANGIFINCSSFGDSFGGSYADGVRFVNCSAGQNSFSGFDKPVVGYNYNANGYTFDGGPIRGDGSELTGIRAEQITSGTLPVDRIPAATPSSSGLLTAADKQKLDLIPAGGVTFDDSALVKLDGSRSMQADLDIAGNRLIGVAPAVEDLDAASQGHVKTLMQEVPGYGDLSMGLFTSKMGQPGVVIPQTVSGELIHPGSITPDKLHPDALFSREELQQLIDSLIRPNIVQVLNREWQKIVWDKGTIVTRGYYDPSFTMTEEELIAFVDEKNVQLGGDKYKVIDFFSSFQNVVFDSNSSTVPLPSYLEGRVFYSSTEAKALFDKWRTENPGASGWVDSLTYYKDSCGWTVREYDWRDVEGMAVRITPRHGSSDVRVKVCLDVSPEHKGNNMFFARLVRVDGSNEYVVGSKEGYDKSEMHYLAKFGSDSSYDISAHRGTLSFDIIDYPAIDHEIVYKVQVRALHNSSLSINGRSGAVSTIIAEEILR